MQMSFVQKSKEVLLQGDPAFNRTVVSLKSLIKTTDVEFWEPFGPWEFLKARLIRRGRESPMMLKRLLDKFEGVFKESNGLPPIRENDHAIVIKVGCGPESVCPYHYAHSQNNEMEIMLFEMLKPGVIQPSNSRYSIRLS